MGKYLEKLEQDYKAKQDKWKEKIRKTPSKFMRFWKWVWFLIAFPFVWLFYNIRDWRSLICVLISAILWSASVWIWYLLAIVTGWETDTAKWFLGVGTTVWIWWASPVGSPFILLVTITAIGMKTLLDKIRNHKLEKKRRKEMAQKCPDYVESEEEKQR